jgi:signal transduction histidine kinase
MGVGIVSVDPTFGFRWQSPIKFWRDKNTVRERPLYFSLLVVFSVFIIAGIATSQSLNRLIGTIQDVAETQAHIQELDRLLIGLLNAESGQRGFLLTGHDDYLDPYFEGSHDYDEARNDLREWILQNPQYSEAFKKIEDSAAIKLHELGETIVWRKAQGLAAANKVVRSDVGRTAMRTIREQVQFIKNDQMRLLLEQKEENRRQTANTISSITVGSLLAAVLLLASLNLYMRNSLKRSRVEEEVRHLNKTLESKIHEVEVVNKELESFSYSVSHDLRAPLRAMAGFSNILVEDYEDKIDEAGRGYLRRIIAASDRMARLIDGILDLSKISRRQVRREEVDLSAVAEQVIAELRLLEPERQAEVVIEPQMKVRGDIDLIGALLQNLLANAWKFTSKKELAHIHFASTIQDGKRVFFIRDDGAGFDMTYAEKLFGTFQRLHTEEDFKGTGVGLATVRRIAHLHGGEVWAEGAVNQGATFYFTLGS